ncbi:hypothetical protein FMUAM8_46820 [Nocardia cyriacigeorgica]|nr:hypothetical protein FMUAM8_46820 [Nocardia cyriacigeorgica]BDU08333.1 hypothetical protein FMUBM48_45960 [Nocardia cyriacigeorgica]
MAARAATAQRVCVAQRCGAAVRVGTTGGHASVRALCWFKCGTFESGRGRAHRAVRRFGGLEWEACDYINRSAGGHHAALAHRPLEPQVTFASTFTPVTLIGATF